MIAFAPKYLELRDVMADMGATPASVAKYLQVTERSVWRWLADGSAPRAALLALWHVTPEGQQVIGVHHGNGVMYDRGRVRALEVELARHQLLVSRLEQELDRATRAAGVSVPANCPVFRTG